MPFTKDIFISYAHIDNQPFGDPKGWVDNLFERLSIRLAQLLGREADIWWDARLQDNEYFVGEIGDRISGSRLLVSVLTPRYVQSAWCRGELKEFSRRAGGMPVGNLARIFKVVKTHIGADEYPEEVQGMSGYLFYEFDDRDRLREFRQEIHPNKDQRYWDKLDDLAWDIKKTIETLGDEPEKAADQTPDSAPLSGPTSILQAGPLPLEQKIYLAESATDVDIERARVRRELMQRGYYVVPDRELPQSIGDLKSTVSEYLSGCSLSVHLLGAKYGRIPDGESTRSVDRIQEELAAERASNDASFSRLIWTPQGVTSQHARERSYNDQLIQSVGPDREYGQDARQQQYLNELQARISAGTEFLQTSVEELKTRLLEKLSVMSANGKSSADSSLTRVYLICDNSDLDDVTPIEEWLYGEGFEVITPAGAGELSAQFHRESLVNCDAALIYYGHAEMPWLRTKLFDLQKAPGWGRSKPLRAKGIYVSGPATAEKQRFRTREVPLVMQNFKEFSPEVLRPFVNALQTSKGGQI